MVPNDFVYSTSREEIMYLPTIYFNNFVYSWNLQKTHFVLGCFKIKIVLSSFPSFYWFISQQQCNYRLSKITHFFRPINYGYLKL